jgi:hypothetical protein
VAGKRYEVGQAVVPIVAEAGNLKRDLDAAKSQIGQLTNLGKSAGALLKGGLYGVAGAAALKFAKDSLAAYSQVQRATLRLEATAMRYGATLDGLSDSVGRYLDAVENTTRFQDTEAADSVNNLIRYTKDLTTAFELNNLAMDLAERTGMGLSEASGLLGQAFTGNERGLATLSRALGITGDAAKNAEALFTEMDKRIKGAATNTEDLKGEWAKLKAVLENTTESFWGQASPMLTRMTRQAREAAQAMLGQDGDTTEQGRRQKETLSILEQRTKAMAEQADAEQEIAAIRATDRSALSSEQDQKNVARLAALTDQTRRLGDELARLDEAYRKLSAQPIARDGLAGKAGKNQEALNAAEQAKDIAEGMLEVEKLIDKQLKETLTTRRKVAEILALEGDTMLGNLDAFTQLQAAAGMAREEQIAKAERLSSAIKGIGASMASVQANEMEAFFTAMKQGTVDGALWYEALGRAILKSAISAFGDVLIQEAAVYNFRALAAGLALDFPGVGRNLLAGAALASAGGGFKALAAGLNKGGYAIGGSAVEDSIPAMIRKNEAVVPLDDPRAMADIGAAMAAAGSSGGMRVGSFQVVLPNVRDAKGFSSQSTALAMLKQLQRVQARTGRNFATT